MLHLDKIQLSQFKNYKYQQFQFKEKIVGITGNNGIGKTNLLDAIYYLCFTKSYFGKTEANSVHYGYQGMRLEGDFIKNNLSEKIICILRENNKKEITRNNERYEKFSEHLGQFPIVMIAPDDIELINGNSDVRRKFLDTLISQLDGQYLQSLIGYNKVLLQRNSLLKIAAEKGHLEESLLLVLNDQLTIPCNYIYETRKKFLKDFLPMVEKSYNIIAGTAEPLKLNYVSQLFNNSFEQLLLSAQIKDKMLQRTTVGIHRDDIEFKLQHESFKNIASQGQRKSLLFGLKIKEFEALKQAKGFSPILLLDDVFEKLDAQRMQNLLSYVCKNTDCQVFITDTHKDRLEKSLKNLHIKYQIIEL